MRSLSVLTAVCMFVFITPLLAQSDTCLSHFQESGSLFTGKVLDTYQEFPGIDKHTALHRLETQLPNAGVSIASVEIDAGTIKGERQDPLLSRPFPVAFTVSPTASGVRVRLWLKTMPGQLPVGRFKHGLCDMFKLVTAESPSEAKNETAEQEAQPSSSETSAESTTVAPESEDTDQPLSAEAIAKVTDGPPDRSGDKEAGNAHKKKQQKALTNEDIVAMVKAELGDKIVIAKIRSAPGDKLDTSADALIRLKKAGVSKAVIDAMIKRGDE